MIIVAKYLARDAKQIQKDLMNHELFNKSFKSKKEGEYLYSALTKKQIIEGVEFEERESDFLPKSNQPISLREALQDILTSEELALLKSAYDVVGTIGIVEIDEEIRHKELLIGETLLSINSLLQTVLRKDGSHSGEFRTQKMKLLAGVDTRETIHKENGARITINVESVYYSPRLSNERIRIAKLVKPGERILHMFSGCAPCECVIGKNAQPKEQIGIELNPSGYDYGLQNITLNKLKNVTLYNADAKVKTPQLGSFDRITMNLPKSAYEFLDEAISASHDGTILHYYDFLHEDEFDIAKQRVIDACKKQSKSCEIVGVYTCGAQGVRTYRICVDVKIINTHQK